MEILKRQAHHLVSAKSNKTNRNQSARTIQATDQLTTNPILAMIPILKRQENTKKYNLVKYLWSFGLVIFRKNA